MAITPGTRLGPYEIVSALGAGGMGEVYRARDTKLDRDVALKILPESFASDPDRLMRFEREAKTLASLNHPNIAAIYGIEDRAIVMELVEGRDLSEVIAGARGLQPPGVPGAQAPGLRTNVPLDEAIAIARQIAEALEAAHEAGIIHRDLKPANIKVRADGTVKVLDFGLAKAWDPSGTDSSDGRIAGPTAATMTSPALTQMGIILGTAAYMAPEQAKGRTVDRRADIWAFGVVLYEMLTGRPLFQAGDVSETLAAVLRAEIDWTALPGDTPRSVRRLLERCLERDVRRRLRDMGDARLELEDPDRDEIRGPEGTSRWVVPTWWVLAVSAVVAVGAYLAGSGTSQPAVPRAVVFDVDFGNGLTIVPKPADVAISPDGQRVAFVATDSDRRNFLVTRRLDDTAVTRLRELEGLFGAPFFSFDSQWIAFASQGRLWKIPATGGPVQQIVEAVSNHNGVGHWGAAGDIALTISFGGVSKISTTDQTVQSAETQFFASFLPDGKTLLSGGSAPLAVRKSGSEELRQLLSVPGAYARYVASGHLVFLGPGGILQAVAFDPESLEVLGEPVALVENVASFSASDTGTVVFSHSHDAAPKTALVWIDDTGRVETIVDGDFWYRAPLLSGDGRLLFSVSSSDGAYVAVRDLASRTTRRVTPPGVRARDGLWVSPDDRQVLFMADDALWVTRADGGGAPRRLLDLDPTSSLQSISPDGRTLAIHVDGRPDQRRDIALGVLDRRRDIALITFEGSGDTLTAQPPRALLATATDEINPRFSPDGRWLAYASDEGGAFHVYVASVANPEVRWRVSAEVGYLPQWSPDAKRLYFRGFPSSAVCSALPPALLVASYSDEGDTFVPGEVRPFAETIGFPFQGATSTFAVGAGDRVVAALTDPSVEPCPNNPLRGVILNVSELIVQRSQAGGR